MFYFYIVLIVVLFLVGIFFAVRSLVILFSLFSKAPYVPLGKFFVKKSLKFLNLGEGDSFLDVGSGDGRVVFRAERDYPDGNLYKGIELNRFLFMVSKLLVLLRKKENKIVFERCNALKFDYRGFNKIHMYLLPDLIDELMPLFEDQVSSGTVVVSSLFEIPELYKRSGKITVKNFRLRGKMRKIFIWEKF